MTGDGRTRQSDASDRGAARARGRMTGTERREQLIEIGRAAVRRAGLRGHLGRGDRGTAEVSKPVVYEHFGGKEGLYAVVVDREIARAARR